ncbi:MAG: hypothetical protein JW751_07190 [Polyangiaceae bacterium]|nr:hypothetical protein [Polyangiaceae bacterium]
MWARIAIRPRWHAALLALAPIVTVGLVVTTLVEPAYNEPFFVHTAYYALLALVLLFSGVKFLGVDGTSPRGWAREHVGGLAVAGTVGIIAVLAITPSMRVLADEANLVGVSKHLYLHRAADFPITGKWYFENYWTLTSTTDRRPALYPFLVSLLHLVRGYHVENAYHVNTLVLIVLVFASYRLAKTLGGEALGMAAGFLVGAHPNILIAARSAGFDLLATCLLVVSVHNLVEASRVPAPRRIALVVLSLCLLANVRYEGWALLLLGGLLLVATRVATVSGLRGFGWLYSILPLLLLPRYWQTIAKAGDSEQPLSTSLFGIGHFWQNASQFLGVVLGPLDPGLPHNPLVVALGLGGLVMLSIQSVRAWRAGSVTWQGARVTLFIVAVLVAETVLCFSYVWGRSLHPASARLFLWLDVTTGFLAAWLATHFGRLVAVPLAALGPRLSTSFAVAMSAVLFAMAVPGASEARFINSLTLTRQASAVWRYLEGVGDRRILVLSDRPGLYTIYDYGSLDISTVQGNRSLIFELSRNLYTDIYLVQEVDLETHRASPKFDPWPDVPLETVLEFQNTESLSIRIARVQRSTSIPEFRRSESPPALPPVAAPAKAGALAAGPVAPSAPAAGSTGTAIPPVPPGPASAR